MPHVFNAGAFYWVITFYTNIIISFLVIISQRSVACDCISCGEKMMSLQAGLFSTGLQVMHLNVNLGHKKRPILKNRSFFMP
jgi:hypothetical protein